LEKTNPGFLRDPDPNVDPNIRNTRYSHCLAEKLFASISVKRLIFLKVYLPENFPAVPARPAQNTEIAAKMVKDHY
jgi:hypothetical protein